MRDLTVVMPCLNEAETLGSCIVKAHKSFEKLGLDGEVLVADNGSTDGSIEIAERLGARVVHVKEKGYGNALRGGFEAAEGKWILMADADDSYDFGDIAPFVEKLKEGNDLVMGCRLPNGGGKIMPGAMPWKHRWIGNPALSGIGRLFFKSHVRDFHCGMRAFTREAYQQMTPKTTGMEFASEMVIKATLKGMRIGEVPITLHKDGRSKPPHLRSWRDGWRHLRFMLLYCPTWLFLIPGLALLTAGIVFGAILWNGPLFIGKIGFDTNTLLVCSMSIILGMQITLFGIFTRVFAVSEGFLPPKKSLDEIYNYYSLEKGLVTGFIIFVFGSIMLVNALFYWKKAGFGAIPYSEGLRQVIPAVTLTTVGAQVIFSSFFLSILSLPRK